MYEMRARWWSPRMGAFTSIDGFGFMDEASDLWGWGGQSPSVFVDPFGHHVAPINPDAMAARKAANLNDMLGTSADSAALAQSNWSQGNYATAAFYENGSVGEFVAAEIYDLLVPGRPNYTGAEVIGLPEIEEAEPICSFVEGLPANESWGNAGTLARHFREHGGDFGSPSADAYAQEASAFLQRAQAEGPPTQIDSDGVIRVFDPGTNTFGAYNADGTTRTFFNPSSPGYWGRQGGDAPWTPGGE
jgi:hypothetical protein